MSDQIEAQAAAARAAEAQMVKDWNARPDVKLAAAEAKAAVMGNDTLGRVAADREIAKLRAEVDKAPADAQPLFVTEAQRISNAINGVVDHLDSELTVGQQVPARDFSGAIQDDLNLGLREELVRNFYATGKGGDPAGREAEIAAATEWKRRLDASPEMQAKLLAGDRELLRQLRAYAMYAPAPHEM